MSKNFEIEREIIVHATPEQVFAAVTDGLPGWLFPVTAPPADGTPDESGNRALVWDAPNHLHTRMEGPDGWFNALEHIIEARDGGTTSVRYVHSGVFADDWDIQFDGAGKHTDFYLHSLGQYLENFAGRPVTYIDAPGTEASQFPGAVEKLHAALGLTGREVGDKITLDIPGLDPVEGEVDYLRGQFVGIRTADSLLRFYSREPWGMPVAAAHHVFAADADADTLTKSWNAWLDGVFA